MGTEEDGIPRWAEEQRGEAEINAINYLKDLSEDDFDGGVDDGHINELYHDFKH